MHGRHGQGDVAVPAGVAADLVVVQAAFLLRSLEAFLDGPAAARIQFRSVSVFTPRSAATGLTVAPGLDRYNATASALNSTG